MSRYISPYVSSWEVLARLSQHDAAGALSLMRRLFEHMATHDPASTMWEKVTRVGAPAATSGSSGPGATSLAHGWSTGPVPALSAYVLGLRPTAPGWATWIVGPQPAGLGFAQGQVGTPRGRLVSRWTRRGGSFRLTVAGPAGTIGKVAVPLLGRNRAIARDGRLVWPRPDAGGPNARRRGGAVVFTQRGGIHTYAWSGRRRR